MTLRQLRYLYWKNTKKRWWEARLNAAENHPHRLASVALSGTAEYIIDQRDFSPTPSTYALYQHYTWDLSLLETWTRVFQTKRPWTPTVTPAPPGEAEFLIWHKPIHPWRFYFESGALPAFVVIGNLETIAYTRPTSGDPWTAGTPSNTDLTGQLGFAISGGGDGPGYGRGDDSDDEKAIIQIQTGGNDLALWNLVEILRLPWDDAWAAESTAFSDALDAVISAGNTTDGGGHSGSCSFTLTFT